MEMLVIKAKDVETIAISFVSRVASRGAYSMQRATLCLRFLIEEPQLDGVDNAMKYNLGANFRTQTGEFIFAVGTSSI